MKAVFSKIFLLVFCLLALSLSCSKDSNNKNILENSGYSEVGSSALKAISVNALLVDNTGYKWIGTPSGLFVYNNLKWYKCPKFGGWNIYSITKHHDEVLLGTSNGAVTLKMSATEISVSEILDKTAFNTTSDTVYAYSCDMYENKWAGTPEGLAFFDGSTWKKNRQIRNNLGGMWDVRSMAFRNDDYFFGTYGRYIFHIKYEKSADVDGVTGASPMIGGAEDPTNNFNGELITDTIFSVFASSDTALWYGSKTGLTKNKGETNKNTGLFEYYARGERVHCVFESSDKYIWAGSETGLLCRENDIWKKYDTSNGLPGNIVQSLAEDKDMSLWIGTSAGLCHFKNGSFTTIE